MFGSPIERMGRASTAALEPDHPLADEEGIRADVLDMVGSSASPRFATPEELRLGIPMGGRGRAAKRAPGAAQILRGTVSKSTRSGFMNSLHGSPRLNATSCGGESRNQGRRRGDRTDRVRQRAERFDSRGATRGQRRAEPVCREDVVPRQLDRRRLATRALDAATYGRLASQTAKAMRRVDSSVELVVCGITNAEMPTFRNWEREVLGLTYDDVDYISCHAYYEEEAGNRASFLGSGVGMDRFVESVTAIVDEIEAERGTRDGELGVQQMERVVHEA